MGCSPAAPGCAEMVPPLGGGRSGTHRNEPKTPRIGTLRAVLDCESKRDARFTGVSTRSAPAPHPKSAPNAPAPLWNAPE